MKGKEDKSLVLAEAALRRIQRIRERETGRKEEVRIMAIGQNK